MIATKAKPKTVNWSKAKSVKIPIPRTGKTFRAYPEDPPRPCEVAASFSFAPAPGGRWAWRIELDTPLYKSGDPESDKRAHLGREELAVRAALDKIFAELREQVDFRRKHKQTEVASACAQAVWHVEQFIDFYNRTGKFRTQPMDPGGRKPREEFQAEVEAVMEQGAKSKERGEKKPEVRGQRSEAGLNGPRFKSLGAEMRRTLVAKSAAIVARRHLGEIELSDGDLKALLDVTTNVEAARDEHVRRAIMIVQDERYAKREARGQRTEVGGQPSTAIATVAPIDVVSQPLEKLTKSEEADLRRCIKTIEREAISAEATDLALIEVQEKQLWRKTHASFQAWIEGTKFAGKTLDRASAYLRIHATRIRRKLAAVKNPPAVEITSPSQCKSIPADIDAEDLRAVILKIKPDPDRKRRWTDDLMRRLLHEDRTDAEQLRQEEFERKNRAADAARLRAAQKQLGAHQAESREDCDDAGDIPAAETPSTPAEWQRAAQENTLAAIASQEGWWGMLNQTPLDGLSSIVYRLQALRLGERDGEFSRDLAALLHSLAAEIEGERSEVRGQRSAARRAK